MNEYIKTLETASTSLVSQAANLNTSLLYNDEASIENLKAKLDAAVEELNEYIATLQTQVTAMDTNKTWKV